MTTRNGVDAVKIVLGLALTVAVCVATVIGYRYYTQRYTVTTQEDGHAAAQVVAATLFARNDLRVSQLSGTVQGVGQTSRAWGWLSSSQVVKAPFTVDYFLPLERLRLQDMRYDAARQVLFVQAPDVSPAPANIDLARTSLNQTKGVFVTRGAMAEMSQQAAASAGTAAHAKAISPENMDRARLYGRRALERLFGGALRAAGINARVEVRYAGEPQPQNTEEWDFTRSLQEVLGNGG